MGDRGNIVVRSSQSNRDDVWFYTHWTGSEIEGTVASALEKKWRWSDASYLARIIFDELTQQNHGDETGFGISTRMGDNEHPICVVDQGKRRVFQIEENELVDGRILDGWEPKESWMFEEFIAKHSEELTAQQPG